MTIVALFVYLAVMMTQGSGGYAPKAATNSSRLQNTTAVAVLKK
jgi:hypothetical protein